MIDIQLFTPENRPAADGRTELLDFLFEQLEHYGDEREAISACMAYALKERESLGGFIVAAREDGKLLGVSIINHTGMGGYIPEHILVYIATHRDARGKGVGRKIIETIIDRTEGDIALHVEPDNPAKYLYEKTGFTNKYLEMRRTKTV